MGDGKQRKGDVEGQKNGRLSPLGEEGMLVVGSTRHKQNKAELAAVEAACPPAL